MAQGAQGNNVRLVKKIKFKKQKLAFIYKISKVKLIDNKIYMCFELSQAQFEKS